MRPTLQSFARAVLATSTLSALAACASGGLSSGALFEQGTTLPKLVTTSRDSYVIAAASLPRDQRLTDVVSQRWPQMVRGELPRGDFGLVPTQSLDRFGVYDSRGAFLGGPDYLVSVRADDVIEIRRLTAGEESALLGRRHPAGAIILQWRYNAR
ncbi:hypothetical protein J421_1824 [Gemmatirosa kalamazoonensis]|jgi:hypothetical protein|uniref:Lipoprotein n=1 Tax=Gemmatirosa kalamazoonensis TaxID=861299 RepID=W0REZ6_9BACT|nr:hypothetical protein [Gemmatirosa kalamazoonensis]AHG89361.1 hypothetical protein J421_1824 [Gemmatirosa kalamazoonensis]